MNGLKFLVMLLRVLVLLGIVVFAYYFPAAAGVLLALVLLIALCSIIGSFLLFLGMRKLFRYNGRIKCISCDGRPLKLARICPSCHTPTLFSLDTLHSDKAAQYLAMQVAIIFTKADGSVEESEKEFLKSALNLFQLSEEEADSLLKWLNGDEELKLDALSYEGLSLEARRDLLDLAASVIVTDEEVDEAEESLFYELVDILQFKKKSAKKILGYKRDLLMC